MAPVDTSARLAALRTQLTQAGVDAFLIPSEDAHASEYIQDADKRREFISGFSGSAGTALVTQSEAWLWTDGRYHLQAGDQLGPGWTLMKQGLPDVKSWQEHLATLAPLKIGLDPKLIMIQDYNALLPTLPAGTSLVPTNFNLVDQIWNDQPPRPTHPIILHPLEHAGKSTKAKLDELRAKCRQDKKWGVVVSILDEVAWLLNLRGSDILYNPVFVATLVVPAAEGEKPSLFLKIDPQNLSQEVYDYLNAEHILIEPYDHVETYLSRVGASLPDKSTVLLHSKTSLALALAIGLPKCTVERSPVADLKAVKNPAELRGFRECHKRDGVALCRYFAWLEAELQSGAQITEYEGATKLEELRSELDGFRGLSFDTISSTGANAAVIHYQPPKEGSAVIDKDEIYLCDSGAQFADGTTDTTRTLHFGTPTEQERRAATRVLQGHIAIDTAIFPSSISGFQLDLLARTALWADGLDYRHGTGHGVGSALNVHEGPMGIGTRVAYNDTRLAAGHVVSNEPGFYLPGKFGIRIENIVIIKPAELPAEYGGPSGFLRMEHVTMVPIATNLVDPGLLAPAELAWLNAYNAEVRGKIEPLLVGTGDERAVEWLRRSCLPLAA